MDHYIKEALSKTKTIIIPGIGALTRINELTGELMFMDYLKHDDGTLANFISSKEGISEQEAKNLLAKHSREITSILNKHKLQQHQADEIHKPTDRNVGKGNIEIEPFQKGKPEQKTSLDEKKNGFLFGRR